MSTPDYDAEFEFRLMVRVRHCAVGGAAMKRLEETVRAEASRVLSDFFGADCALPSDPSVEVDSVEVARVVHAVNR